MTYFGKRSHSESNIFLLCVILALLQYILLPAGALGGDYFEYSILRKVGGGTGEYAGYSDELISNGKYEIQAATESHVQFHAVYSWTYENSEGLRQNGSEDRIAGFSTDTRHYTTPKTDLDEYDKYNSSSLSVWLWIPPDIKAGDTVRILDDTFTVTSLDANIWQNWLPRKGIELHAAGTGSRDDEYGNFTYTYTDTYYFDRATGYIIAERYREKDTGSWQGKPATFEKTEEFDIKHSSYAVPMDYRSLIEAVLGIAGVIVFIGFIEYKLRWQMQRLKINPYGDVKIYRIRSLKDFPLSRNAATKYFEPFIEDFVNKALIVKDRVGVAASTELLGLAIYNSEAKIGMILCENTEVKEALRRYVGMEDFFSEVRSTIPDKIINEAAQWGTKIENPYAYNVFDTYQIVRLGDIPDMSYDTELISRMKEDDLPEIEEISRKVYGVKSKQWLRAQLRSGDIGFVARTDGRIAGFAFTTYAKGHGRIHTLTVLPEYQNRGIGKELMRARLKTLHDLGASDVIAEIANWNLSSLEISHRFGFKQAGTMYVETTRTSRIKKTIVRR